MILEFTISSNDICFKKKKFIKLETVRNDVVTIFKLRLAQREKRECKEKASLRAGPHC